MEICLQPERRAFLGKAVFLLGGATVASVLPASLLAASPACMATDPCRDWQLDDMCSAYPPYAYRHDAGQARMRARAASQVDPLDALFAA
jgi:hypothetical protein